MPGDLSEQQIERYSRQIILKQIGGKGQKRLLESKVLLVGAGGLGSAAAMYLAAAGVGKLGIVDYDRVALSNLQRQVLHRTGDAGRRKVESAKETLNALNPDVQIITYPLAVSPDSIMDIVHDYEVVIDGSDNFPTRYLVNDACVLAGKPNVHGSVLMFDGTATLFLPGKGCYRCLFPNPPPPDAIPTCAGAGVLGMLPGIIGLIQATETMKLLLNAGRSLSGRLIVFDALDMEFREMRWKRNPACPVCGDKPAITSLLPDYGQTCGIETR